MKILKEISCSREGFFPSCRFESLDHRELINGPRFALHPTTILEIKGKAKFKINNEPMQIQRISALRRCAVQQDSAKQNLQLAQTR